MAKLVPIRVGPLDHICLSILQETYIANLGLKWEKVFFEVQLIQSYVFIMELQDSVVLSRARQMSDM